MSHPVNANSPINIHIAFRILVIIRITYSFSVSNQRKVEQGKKKRILTERGRVAYLELEPYHLERDMDPQSAFARSQLEVDEGLDESFVFP